VLKFNERTPSAVAVQFFELLRIEGAAGEAPVPWDVHERSVRKDGPQRFHFEGVVRE
jgi:hypothetical protein